MRIVHLFVSYGHVNLCMFLSLPPGVGCWLRLLLMALPGLFCLSFWYFCRTFIKHSILLLYSPNNTYHMTLTTTITDVQSMLYYRVFALISMYIVPRWDIEGRTRACKRP